MADPVAKLIEALTSQSSASSSLTEEQKAQLVHLLQKPPATRVPAEGTTEVLDTKRAIIDDADRQSTASSLPVGASASNFGVSQPGGGLGSLVVNVGDMANLAAIVASASGPQSVKAEAEQATRTASKAADDALTKAAEDEAARKYLASFVAAKQKLAGIYDAGIRRIGLKDVSISEGGSGGELSSADVDATFGVIGLQWVTPVLGDVNADLSGLGELRTPLPTWPRNVLARRSWTTNIQLPQNDFIMGKTGEVYPARVPAGAVLKEVLHAYNTSGLEERRDGNSKEAWVYGLMIDTAQGRWNIERDRASGHETEIIGGIDAAFQAALDGGLTSELRLFATLLGLNSFLLTAPNEVVSALTHLRKVPEHINMSAQIFTHMSWLVQATVSELVTQLWGPGAFGGANPVVGCAAFGALPAGSVRIYGGSKGYTVEGCELGEAGEPYASGINALNAVHFVYKTAVEAFAPEEVRVQLCLYHGFPVREIHWPTNGGGRNVYPFISSHRTANYNGIAIWLKEPVTRATLMAAPYGAGAVLQLVPPPAPKGKAAAPIGAAIIPHWPPAGPNDLPTRKQFAMSLMRQVGYVGVSQTLLSQMAHVSTRTCGKPAAVFGAAGMTVTRVDQDIDDQIQACVSTTAEINDYVNHYNQTMAGPKAKGPFIPAPVPKPKGMPAGLVANGIMLANNAAKVPGMIAVAPLPKLAALPAVKAPGAAPAKAAAPVVVPSAPKFAMPPVAAIAPGGVPALPIAPPAARAPPAKAATIPNIPGQANDATGRAYLDLLDRSQIIHIPAPLVGGIPKVTAAKEDENVRQHSIIAQFALDHFMSEDIQDLVKKLLIMTDPYPYCSATALRAYGFTSQWFCPEDNQDYNALAGPPAWAAHIAQNRPPLTALELERRREYFSEIIPGMDGAAVTAQGLEVARQLEMRAGVIPPISLVETMLWRGDGRSGWPAGSSPFCPTGLADIAIAGTNFSTCAIQLPSVAMGSWGVNAASLTADLVAAAREGERVVSVMDYLPWHRLNGELPVQAVRRTDSDGMREPIIGQLAAAALLNAPSHGDTEEASLFTIVEAERNTLGYPGANTPVALDLLNANAVLCHRVLPIQIPVMSHELRKPLTSYLKKVPTEVFRELNDTQRVLGVYVESIEAAPMTQVRPERTAARPSFTFVPGPVMRTKRTARNLNSTTSSEPATKAVKSTREKDEEDSAPAN